MVMASSEMTIHSNLMFLLADVLEVTMMDTQNLLNKDGYELKHEAKRNFKAALANLRRLRHISIDGCSERTQNGFANDSDRMYEFIKMLIDRVGEDDANMKNFYEYIQSHPSQCNMIHLDSSVFDDINVNNVN